MNTEKIAQFIAETRYELIPEKAIRVAKRCILDTVGVALAGSQEPEGVIVTEFCRERRGGPAASIIAGGFKTSEPLASLANGAMAHALDFDDISIKSLGHPSAALVPAVLALGERKKMPGKDVLTSYVVGFEVATRVGAALGVEFSGSNWHPTPIVGSIAAAGASARILGLTAQQSKMALGIASSLAGGLKQNFGTMTKPLHAGNASHNGVIAGLLAEKGFTSNQNILENDEGFCQTFAGQCHVHKISNGLGVTWDIMNGVSIKAYPCCGTFHGSIDAVLELRRKYGFSLEAVAEIECRTSPIVRRMTIDHFPRTVQESRFSIEYVVATALLDGAVSLKQFCEQKLVSPLTRKLMSKIKCYYPEDLRHRLYLPHEVVIRLTNGEEYSRKIEKNKGTPGNPLTDEELFSKFTACASLVLSKEDIKSTLDLISHLEQLEDISKFMKLVANKKTSDRNDTERSKQILRNNLML